MRYLILDVETTIKNKGHPFTPTNRLCYTGVSLYGSNQPPTVFNHIQQGVFLPELQKLLDSVDCLVAFNAKFDCHWLERSGYVLDGLRIWDLQYASYLFSHQRTAYPSLEGEASKAGFGSKLDVVKTEYWEKGIDTLDIPTDVIVQYLVQDVNLEVQLFQYQLNLFKTTERSKYRLFQLHMEDQNILREMEKNGILYDVENSLKAADEASTRIQQIEAQLRIGYENCPINFDSTDHLSAYLYGGTISVDSRIPIGVYKSGQKIGQTRYKIVTHEYKLPRIFEPLPKSELKKDGLWSTDEPTLKQLRGSKEAKKRISLLDERAKLEKLRSTYFGGFPKKVLEMAWTDNTLHSSLNQCVVVTGRLSSSNPNQQNLAPEAKKLCLSRYGDT